MAALMIDAYRDFFSFQKVKQRIAAAAYHVTEHSSIINQLVYAKIKQETPDAPCILFLSRLKGTFV